MSDFAEFHEELRSVARRVLAPTAPQGRADDESEPLQWEVLENSGWLGLEVPEDLGGSGVTFAEVAVVLHELGRAATPSGFVGTAVLGARALGLAEVSEGRDVLLRRIAGGDARVAVAIDGARDARGDWSTGFRLTAVGERLRLDGDCGFVIDAADADELLLVALDPEGRPVLVRVAPDADGVVVTPQPVLDATRRFGSVSATGVEVAAGSVLPFGGDADVAAQLLFDRAALAVACDSLGLAEAMLDATVAYAKERHQFGRPIGSFQAVKHACANMLVEVSIGRELLAAALETETATEISMAKAYLSDAAVGIVGAAMQLHGGIGYTWESGIHVYLKRATLNRSLFGSPIGHRARLASRYPGGVNA